MAGWRAVGEELRSIALGLVAALLPAPENRRCGVAWGVDVVPYSGLIGVVEAVAGSLLFFFGAIAFMSGEIPFLTGLLLENWFEGLSTTHIRGAGILALVIWCAHPLAWLFILVGVTGAVRIAGFATSREPVGEPLVWLALRVAGLVRGLATDAKKARDFGPLRSDRLVWDGDCDLQIITCRERPEWTEGVSLEVEGRFFRRFEAEERLEGVHHVKVYRFRELDPNEVIRGPLAWVDTAEELADGGKRS